MVSSSKNDEYKMNFFLGNSIFHLYMIFTIIQLLGTSSRMVGTKCYGRMEKREGGKRKRGRMIVGRVTVTFVVRS